MDEALNHSDLELLRPPVPVVTAKSENGTASVLEAKKESSTAAPPAPDVPITAINADGTLSEAVPAAKAAEAGAEKVDPSVDNGQRAQTQSTAEGEPSSVAQPAARPKESAPSAAECRANATVVKEEHDASSAGVAGGNMSASLASPSVAVSQSDAVSVNDGSKAEQAVSAPYAAPPVPVVSTPTHSLPAPPIVAPAAEPPIKPPKTPGVGRGSKQQLSLATVEASVAPAVGRGVGRGGGGAGGGAVGRPPASPLPAALSPAPAIGEGDEEVRY